MDKISSLREAAIILELPDRFSLEDVKKSYHTLLKRYHPDHCQELAIFCKEKTSEIIAAYRMLYNTLQKYPIALADLESLVPAEFWRKRFASDGVWGEPDNNKQ